MFQSDTYANFLRVLEALVATEMGTEAIRHKLKQRKNFSGSSAFLTICKNRRPERSDLDYQSPVIPEFITHRHIMDLMTRYGHKDVIEELDLHLLVDRFDKDGDGVIGFSEVSLIHLITLINIFLYSFVNFSNPFTDIASLYNK